MFCAFGKECEYQIPTSGELIKLDYYEKNDSIFMKKMFLYFIIILMTYPAKSQENITSFFEIDFQEGFKKDIISLEINQYSIFKNRVAICNRQSLTNTFVKVYLFDEGGLITFCDESLKINKITFPIVLTISLNDNLNEFTIDLEKGKYIGFGKKNNSELEFYQSKIPFPYD
jgi:hypothetical protein